MRLANKRLFPMSVSRTDSLVGNRMSISNGCHRLSLTASNRCLRAGRLRQPTYSSLLLQIQNLLRPLCGLKPLAASHLRIDPRGACIARTDIFCALLLKSAASSQGRMVAVVRMGSEGGDRVGRALRARTGRMRGRLGVCQAPGFRRAFER